MDSFNSKFNLLSVKTGNDYDKFKEGCRKFGHMVYRGRDHLQLGQLLDELNSLDYTVKFLDEEVWKISILISGGFRVWRVPVLRNKYPFIMNFVI